MPIASIGTVLRITPGDELQIIRAEKDYEIVDDRTPFRIRVSDVLLDGGILIGVAGPVIDGHARYRGLIATLITRLDNSDWATDTHSAANFKVGQSVARRLVGFPHNHPEGMKIDGYPWIIRYGSVAAES